MHIKSYDIIPALQPYVKLICTMECDDDADTSYIRVLPDAWVELFLNYTSMRKLILGLAITLDGYIEGPNGEYDWCFTDQDYGLNRFFERIDAIFIGRKSYKAYGRRQDITDVKTLQKLMKSKKVSSTDKADENFLSGQ